jgi:RHS repeat-associated protein
MRWDGVTTRYGYDSLDRLVSVDAPGVAWRAKHDALGRRTEVACNGRVRRQYWDTDRLAAEHFDDGRVRVYVYPDAHALVPLLSVDYASLAAAPESGVVHAWFTSHQGAPEEVTGLDGALVWSGRVAPFGALEVTHGAEFHQPLRWPGHFYDGDAGLHYNRFREYDPRLGRYLQSDPQGISGGDNLYAYAWDDNPLRSVDVRGLACPGEGGDGPEAEDGVDGEGTTPKARGVDEAHAASAAANAAQAHRPRPATVAVLETREGVFVGESGSGQPLHPRVQEVLDAVPANVRSPFHGSCAEPQAISRALEAGNSPSGGRMTAARVRRQGHPAHGTTVPPCSSCAALQTAFNVE